MMKIILRTTKILQQSDHNNLIISYITANILYLIIEQVTMLKELTKIKNWGAIKLKTSGKNVSYLILHHSSLYGHVLCDVG